METKDHKEMARQMDKSGMRVFIAGTVAVYAMSLSYCYSTGRIFETVLVGAVMLGLGVFVGWMYKSA
jgi:predicted membrane channel-forming protein YqfA (hemolysin III family)